MGPVLIISPLFPPLPGGLPDHTDFLAGALARHHPIVVLSSTGVATDRPFPVRASVRAWNRPAPLQADIAQASGQGPILWQYVPHMYGRGGVNLALPRVMRRLRTAGRRQVVIAHEIAAPFSPWPHRSVYALAHRLMWRGILASAHAIGISTHAWLDRLRGNHGKTPAEPRLFAAPSPSNLPVTTVGHDHPARWRSDLGLPPDAPILGFFGSPGSGKQFEWVLSAWRTVRRAAPTAALVVVGGSPTVHLTPQETHGFRALGYLPSEAASRALQAMDLLLLPFIDGVSERRSSFMAGLAHGRPVLTTLGPATGAGLRGTDAFHGVAVGDGIQAFAAAAGDLVGQPMERERLGLAARNLYVSEFDWPRLASTILEHLH